ARSTASSSSSGIGGTIVFSCSGRLSVIVAIRSALSYSSVSKLMWALLCDRCGGAPAPRGGRAAPMLLAVRARIGRAPPPSGARGEQVEQRCAARGAAGALLAPVGGAVERVHAADAQPAQRLG